MPDNNKNIYQDFQEVVEEYRKKNSVFITTMAIGFLSCFISFILPCYQYTRSALAAPDQASDPDISIPLWLTITALIIFLMFLLTVTAYHSKNKLRLKKKEKEAKATIKLLGEIISDVSLEGDINKLAFIQSRLEKEKSLAENLRRGMLFLPAINTYDYLREIYRRIIEDLNPGDLYLTISDLNFWSANNYGSEDFINENFNAITEKQVIIHRVIVIEEKILKYPYEYLDEYGKLKDLLNKLKTFDSQIATYKQKNKYSTVNYSNRFCIVKNLKEEFSEHGEENQDEFTQYLPFAVVIPSERKEKRMLITSKVFNSKKNIPCIKFIFDNEENKPKIDEKQKKFDTLIEGKLFSIEELDRLLDARSDSASSGSNYSHTDAIDLIEKYGFVIDGRKYAIIQANRMEFGNNIIAGCYNGKFYTFVKLYKNTKELESDDYIKKEEDWNLVTLSNLTILPRYCGLISAIANIFKYNQIPILNFSTFDSELVFFPSIHLEKLTEALDKMNIKFTAKSAPDGG